MLLKLIQEKTSVFLWVKRSCAQLKFEDYTHVDDDISVHGALTDAELLNLVLLDKDEEEEQPPIPVTLSEARRCLSNLRFYAL